jgi:hypothetical protein
MSDEPRCSGYKGDRHLITREFYVFYARARSFDRSPITERSEIENPKYGAEEQRPSETWMDTDELSAADNGSRWTRIN